MNNDPTYGPASQSESPQPKPEKDPAAVSLGRRGGLKGGKARAAKRDGRIMPSGKGRSRVRTNRYRFEARLGVDLR
jgi:hypothetical protein